MNKFTKYVDAYNSIISIEIILIKHYFLQIINLFSLLEAKYMDRCDK